MADLRLSANILFAQSIREKENSKELSFLSRIVNAVLMRKTKSPPSYGEWGRAARMSILSLIYMGGTRDFDCKNTNKYL